MGALLTGDLRPGTGQAPAADRRTAGRRRNPARRIAVVLIVTAVLVALVRSLLLQSFIVPTGSMTPTVEVGDRVLVSRMSYRFGQIHRGDVIVFNGSGVFGPEPAAARTALAALGRRLASGFGVPEGSQDFVKRVVGLPGERVVCCDPHGRLTIDGVALTEPYLSAGDVASTIRFDIVVPAGRFWVMGDHRSDSADSRAHLGDPGGGTVPQDRVVGRVVGIYWPLSHAGGLAPNPPQSLDRKDHR